MIYLVLGPSGSGKTKWLIDQANDEKGKGNTNIVFVDSDNDQIYSLDHSVRLIDASNFFIDSVESFRGFIAGILARDYDIGKIYIDGIYDIVDINSENIEKLSDDLTKLSKECNVDFYLGLDCKSSDIPESLDAEIHETKLLD